MRAFIFLAIVGVALGRNLCKGVKNKDVKDMWSIARSGAIAILGGSCPSFDLDSVAFSGACKNIVKQSTCYGIQAKETYGSGVVNYGTLAADVPNMEALGNLACDEAEGCYNQVKAAIQNCMDANENFVADTVAAAEAAYQQNFESMVSDFAAKNSGTFFGDIASMAQSRFTSAADIQEFLEDIITDRVVADAKAAAEQAASLAQAWCDSDCTSQSADFLEGIFTYMNGGECSDAKQFCGECQNRAAEYFSDNALPCCVENVVQKGIEAYDYVVENYSESIQNYRDQLVEQISDAAYSEALAVKDKVVEQFNCVADVYNGNRPACA